MNPHPDLLPEGEGATSRPTCTVLWTSAIAGSRPFLPWLLVALILSGCGSGGGGSSSSGGPTEPSPMIVFTPDGAAAAGTVALRAGPGTTASLLELEIVATGLVNVQTMDFDLTFPGELLRIESFRTGAFLGVDASVIFNQASGGSATFLMTRLDPSGASGSGVVLTVIFSVAGNGEGRLDFVDPEAADPFGLEIPDIVWIGGTVQVVL